MGLIISTTIAGPGTGPILLDALASVAPIVDAHLVIDTSPEGAPAAFATDDPRVIFRRWPWRDDFGAARNAALDFAVELGATWAITVDTDERILIGAFRQDMLTTMAPALSLAYEDGSYTKPRAFRLPCQARWHGRTHEAIAIDAPTVQGAAFTELPKTAEQLRAKRLRDVTLLAKMIAEEPSDARWRYYRADALHALGYYPAAVQSWEDCAEMSAWDEEAAWSCYRAADALLFALGEPLFALERCLAGMSKHPGIAELPWLAAIACQRLGRHEHALYWAALARTHGESARGPWRALDHRRGFRAVKGLRHGPADVERFSLRAVGASESDVAAAEMEFALGQRP